MSAWIAVAIGGALGAMTRYAVGSQFAKHLPQFAVLGTLTVNVTGCLLIGLLTAYLRGHAEVSVVWRVGMLTGFLGALTTFSTFSYEFVVLLRDGQNRFGMLYLCGNLVLGILAVMLGDWLGGSPPEA